MIANRQQIEKRCHQQGKIETNRLFEELYATIGIQAVKEVCGSFSFVLWDGRSSEIVAARDRAGIQSLFYAFEQGIFLISSSQRAISTHHPSGCNFDLLAVSAQASGLTPPLARSYYQRVTEVIPGQIVICSRHGIQLKSYWEATTGQPLKLRDDHAYAQAYRALLTQVANEHVQTTRAAITLTSGLDSNSVAAALVDRKGNLELTALTCITPRFPEADEDQLSTEVANQLQIPLTKLRGDEHFILSGSEGILTNSESPMLTYFSEFWQMIFSQLREVKIGQLITGFGGGVPYEGLLPTYLDHFLSGQWIKLTKGLQKQATRDHQTWQQILKRHVLSPVFQLYTPASLRALVARLRTDQASIFPPYIRSEAISKLTPIIHQESTPRRLAMPGRLSRLRKLNNWLSPRAATLLTNQASEYGIELIQPLTDHRVWEFILSLPSDQIYRAGQDKVIIRNAFKDYLPAAVINKPAKTTPTALAYHGLKTQRSKILPLCSQMRLAEIGIVDELALKDYYQDFLEGRHQDVRFWHTLTAEDWLRRHFS